jgi:uncharacterized protein YuzE
VRVTVSRRTNMGYVYLADPIPPSGVDHTEPLVIDLPRGIRHLINLDFDVEGRLLGIEVDGASDVLPKELLRDAEVL